jgi:predicted esterase
MAMTATYVMRIPWARLMPFHPLLDPRGGFNIQYTSQANDGRATHLTYLDDTHFDSERTPLRRFAPMTFLYRNGSPFSLAGRIESRLMAVDSGSVTFAVRSPERQEVSLGLAVHGQTGQEVWKESAGTMLPHGRMMLRHSFPIPPVPGSYKLVATLGDSLRWEETFCRYDDTALARVRVFIDRSPAVGYSLERISSLESLQFGLDILDERIRTFTGRDDPSAVLHDVQVLLSLARAFESNGTIYGRGGYLLSAFRSPIDSSLQPYSVILPEGYDTSKRYRLYVALHGSGVDEVRFAHAAARNIKDPDAIFVAPRGRDLSGWWRELDEVDAAYLIQMVKTMLPVEKTLCFGFSMGGYGTWRMSFLHPELFDGAAIISGTPVPPGGAGKADDMRTHIGKGKGLGYLVFHGTEDRALPITDTDHFVDMLKGAGYDVTYVRVQGAGHGNMEFGEGFGRWVMDKFLKTAK